MELPVEIRLLIYNDLIVQSAHLHRVECYFCTERAKHYDRIDRKHHANLACAQILRTSKQIYNEALHLLYFKNTVHMKCLHCEKVDYRRTRFDTLWACLGEPKDMENIRPHVKSVAVAYALGEFEHVKCDQITELPARWPLMEHQILASY